jgi:hypothetical protein
MQGEDAVQWTEWEEEEENCEPTREEVFDGLTLVYETRLIHEFQYHYRMLQGYLNPHDCVWFDALVKRQIAKDREQIGEGEYDHGQFFTDILLIAREMLDKRAARVAAQGILTSLTQDLSEARELMRIAGRAALRRQVPGRMVVTALHKALIILRREESLAAEGKEETARLWRDVGASVVQAREVDGWMARIELWKDGMWAPDREEFGALVSDFEGFAVRDRTRIFYAIENRDTALAQALQPKAISHPPARPSPLP